ncbi:hypothetical protein [Aquimarina aggregata]|uniref:hypothetical protein n=1 Tax=Aquimarina aggregata TaxID=1642818 RepID=UPI0024910DA4|nr:hypothetical protein [Aquimarina aggregata]
MKYNEFFQITIDHQYFSDAQMDLVLIPEEQTLQFLRKQHFVVKHTSKGLKVLIPLDEKENRLPVIKEDDTLSFNVFPTTSGFDEITDTSMIDNDSILFFTNKGLKNDSKELVVSGTTANMRKNGFPVIAKIKIELSRVNFDLDKEPTLYQVIFKPKTVKWKYYILSGIATTKLEIKDRDAQLTFGKLENLNDIPDKIATALSLNFPNKQLFVFESSKAIHYSDTARKNIQLFQNENMIIKHLPNPDISDNGIQIIKIN